LQHLQHRPSDWPTTVGCGPGAEDRDADRRLADRVDERLQHGCLGDRQRDTGALGQHSGRLPSPITNVDRLNGRVGDRGDPAGRVEDRPRRGARVEGGKHGRHGISSSRKVAPGGSQVTAGRPPMRTTTGRSQPTDTPW
jgi:hypothetical protein